MKNFWFYPLKRNKREKENVRAKAPLREILQDRFKGYYSEYQKAYPEPTIIPIKQKRK